MSVGASPVRVRREAVRVVVPATSANLGPAFDSAGLALAVYDDLVAMVTEDEGVLVEIAGEGEQTLPRDEQHLVVQSMRSAFDRMGVEVPGFVLRCINSIPHGRGLGSSAAAIIGGIVLARAMVEGGAEVMSDADVLQLALEQEKHPDNLAAALHGSFTVAWIEEDGKVDVVRMPTHPGIRPAVLVPAAELSTAQARGLLPESVSLADATVNIARSALLVHALTLDPTRLMSATHDRIHQHSRASAYPESVSLVSRLRELGVPAVISGAGPSVLAFLDDDAAKAMASLQTGDWIVRELAVSPAGAREVPLQPTS